MSVRRFDAILRSEIEVSSENCADTLPNRFVVVSYQYSHFTRRFGNKDGSWSRPTVRIGNITDMFRVEHTGKALYRASKVETAIFSSVTEPAGCHQTSPSPVLLYA